MKLRPYQENAIQGLIDFFTNQIGNPLLILPTGAGKSVVLASFIKHAMETYENQHILILSHVKEILEQNAQKIWTFWPNAPMGIYSAGIGKKQAGFPLTIASIQSAYKKADVLGYKSLVIIDECHLVPKAGEGMYLKLIEGLRKYNPSLKIIGLTATPFRTSSGLLHRGKDSIFTDIAYEITISELVDQGFLSPLITKSGLMELDVTNVKVARGDYVTKELSKSVDIDSVTQAALDEVDLYAANRKSLLFFCVDVEHATHVNEALKTRGIASACITGLTPKEERENIINDFKSGKIRAITNCNVLTTGFDAPEIDCLVMLRPTKSVGLYVQMAGRGSRIAPGKTNCLVLDFAGNIVRHGPVDAIVVTKEKRGSGSAGDGGAMVKPCPECEFYMHIAMPVCPQCGYCYPKELPHDTTATDAAILKNQIKPEVWDVSSIEYSFHEKRGGGTPSLRVTYNCGFFQKVSEWICLEHTGYARDKAVKWWNRRNDFINNPDARIVPSAIVDGLLNAKNLLKPSRIQVRTVGKYPEICGYDFSDVNSNVPHIINMPEDKPKELNEEHIPF